MDINQTYAFSSLGKLFVQEKELSLQVAHADKKLHELYTGQTFFVKMVTAAFPAFADEGVKNQTTLVDDLKLKQYSLSNAIDINIKVLARQLQRKVNEVMVKILNPKSSGSVERTSHEDLLAEFEAAYDNCSQLMACANTKEEEAQLNSVRVTLVYNLLQNGILPRESWVTEKNEFMDEDMFWDVNYEGDTPLICSVFERGQSDVLQFLCDHVPKEVLLKGILNEYELELSPIPAALRHGHSYDPDPRRKIPGMFCSRKFSSQ